MAWERYRRANVKSASDAEEKVQRLEQEVDELRGQHTVEGARQQEGGRDFLSRAPLAADPLSHLAPSPTGGEPPANTGGHGIQKIVLRLSGTGPHLKKNKPSTPENVLPAGTFAQAVLLGGVDASTAIAASSDPRPVLLRMTDKGTLPRKFCSDLKDCHLLASAYGDLSSERVYMRLEKLTCTERVGGEISETQVAGYVSGEDGKAGVRGVVVDRAGPVIRNSLMGGFFSGMGKFFESSQSQFALPATPFGALNPLSSQRILSAGAASGTSHALEKYAEFFIKRAEQLQPVLQVAAGRAVNVVFTQGTPFGETSVRKALSKIRDKSRKAAVQSLETESTLSTDTPTWLPPLPQGDTE